MLFGWIWRLPMTLSHIDIDFALDFFHVPVGVNNIIQSYFVIRSAIHCVTTKLAGKTVELNGDKNQVGQVS